MDFDTTVCIGDILTLIGGLANLIIFLSIYNKMPSLEFFKKLKWRLHLIPPPQGYTDSNPMNLENIYNTRDTNVSEDIV
jgi:hypothetical protein